MNKVTAWNSNIVFPQEFLANYSEIRNLSALFDEYEAWKKKNGKTFDFDFTPMIKKAIKVK